MSHDPLTNIRASFGASPWLPRPYECLLSIAADAWAPGCRWAGVVLPILELQDIYGPGRGRSPPGPRRTKRLSAPARATPIPGRSEPGCTQDDTRRPGQAGTEVAQALRRPRPES